MVPRQVKSVLKYSISLTVAGGLFWYVYKDLDLASSVAKLKGANYTWVFLSMFLAIISHLFRAYRWNLLLEPMGSKPTLSRTFGAVMVGYLANLVVPRMGEVSRCGILKKTNSIPMTVSIGTVVAERVIDLLSLLLIVFIGFMIEFDRLNDFLSGFFYGKAQMIGENVFFLYILAGVVCIGVVVLFLIVRLFKDKIKKNTLFLKIRAFLREVIAGFTSIRRVKNPASFWFCTIMIWLLYFLMSYVMVFALSSTSSLGIGAGIALLIMGGLGMSAPVQGGIGTYHALVTAVLVLYGIQEADGQVFAFLLHTSQTLMVIVLGSISLILTLAIKKQPKQKYYAQQR